MRPAVREAFLDFTAPLEGGYGTNFMYLDVKGLVTTAFGLLIDPATYALPLPWLRPDKSLATRHEIAAAWMTVKQRQDLKHKGGMAFAPLTNLRLTREGVAELVYGKLDEMDRVLSEAFHGFDSAPADAQMGILSMAWALGPHFKPQWPKFSAAFGAHDFDRCAEECNIRVADNPGVRPRVSRQKVLFRNAARVIADGLDSDALYWPRDLSDESASR